MAVIPVLTGVSQCALPWLDRGGTGAGREQATGLQAGQGGWLVGKSAVCSVQCA